MMGGVRMPVFDPSALPSQPEIIPAELRHLGVDNRGWQARVPPQSVGMFVAAVARWLADPRFGVAVEVTAHDGADGLPAGWTVDVRLPDTGSARDDLL